MRLLVAPGMMPVTDPLLTPVIAVPVVPGLRAALVKNGTAPVVTPFTAGAIVGFTSVTTVAPGCPLTSLTALAKAGLTPVTHVSAEAEANSAAFRLATLTLSKRKRPVMFFPQPVVWPPCINRHPAHHAAPCAASTKHPTPHCISLWPRVWHGDARRQFVLTC